MVGASGAELNVPGHEAYDAIQGEWISGCEVAVGLEMGVPGDRGAQQAQGLGAQGGEQPCGCTQQRGRNSHGGLKL